MTMPLVSFIGNNDSDEPLAVVFSVEVLEYLMSKMSGTVGSDITQVSDEDLLKVLLSFSAAFTVLAVLGSGVMSIQSVEDIAFDEVVDGALGKRVQAIADRLAALDAKPKLILPS